MGSLVSTPLQMSSQLRQCKQIGKMHTQRLQHVLAQLAAVPHATLSTALILVR
eukprot:CAMPEP_0203860636 /NCGR_PEP_ID=MMETSP0359-20131031/12542_1 /ASSEMBLY_ACC=CAM_ASM_000338 /TAXON_ID=268821 /ORGANISM="Scrippsiella Hangoei, Strain SHTV-5" /LENGTH=52 /DNA_ID=CAMNT_0050777741 /DNA_START=216 /DNA_END=370 /DNA_ORIENTATION=-